MRYNLISQRKKKKMTQKNVSDLIEVSRSTYNAYELGTIDPPLEKALKIKEILRYNKDDIFLNENVSKNDKN